MLTSVCGADLSAECKEAKNHLPHILLFVQINCLKQVGLGKSVFFTRRQEIVDVLHLFEWHFHSVMFGSAWAHNLLSQSDQQHKQQHIAVGSVTQVHTNFRILTLSSQ